jgi:hypothetical protein
MIPLKSPKTLAMREEVELDTLSKWVKLNTPSNSQTEEEFEDTKGVIIICKSKKNRQHNLRKFYGRFHDLVDRYGISVSQMTTDMFHL